MSARLHLSSFVIAIVSTLATSLAHADVSVRCADDALENAIEAELEWLDIESDETVADAPDVDVAVACVDSPEGVRIEISSPAEDGPQSAVLTRDGETVDAFAIRVSEHVRARTIAAARAAEQAEANAPVPGERKRWRLWPLHHEYVIGAGFAFVSPSIGLMPTLSLTEVNRYPHGITLIGQVSLPVARTAITSADTTTHIYIIVMRLQLLESLYATERLRIDLGVGMETDYVVLSKQDGGSGFDRLRQRYGAHSALRLSGAFARWFGWSISGAFGLAGPRTRLGGAGGDVVRLGMLTASLEAGLSVRW